jgi:hypothetical protein
MAFTVLKELTLLTMADAVASKNTSAVAEATLKEEDGAPLAGEIVAFLTHTKVKGKLVWAVIGTGVTDASGRATLVVPARYVNRTPEPIRAAFAGSSSFLASSAEAAAYRR